MSVEKENSMESLKRIGGYLHRIIPVRDATGKVIDHILKPVMVEARPRDIFTILPFLQYRLPSLKRHGVWAIHCH